MIEAAMKKYDFPDIHLKMVLEILYTASSINNLQIRHLRPYHLSPQQYHILRVLRKSYPQYLNIQTVRTELIEKTPNTTRMIDKLMANKYIERERRKDDRRKVFVRITDLGLEVLEKIDRLNHDFLHFTHDLNHEEAIQLINLLGKLRERI